jgi:hypothetical protein
MVYANVRYAPNKKITLTAGGVNCRASNVDITLHSCDLTFEAKKVATHGRKAHELYATLAEMGVPPDGAAGSIFEAVSNLDCTIDPGEVKQKPAAARIAHLPRRSDGYLSGPGTIGRRETSVSAST